MSPISVAQKSPTMAQIKAKAKSRGINPGKLKKAELIHSIQVAEGCTPCYGRSNGDCPWTQCCWRGDCFTAKA
jgi:hypothetical protein